MIRKSRSGRKDPGRQEPPERQKQSERQKQPGPKGEPERQKERSGWNMKVQQLIDSGRFRVINEGDGGEREITTPFCCDLLSVAMGRAPSGCAWVTVMGNMNTLAVATLADAACVIMAEGTELDEIAVKKAKDQDITVLGTEEPVFEAALWIWQEMHG